MICPDLLTSVGMQICTGGTECSNCMKLTGAGIVLGRSLFLAYGSSVAQQSQREIHPESGLCSCGPRRVLGLIEVTDVNFGQAIDYDDYGIDCCSRFPQIGNVTAMALRQACSIAVAFLAKSTNSRVQSPKRNPKGSAGHNRDYRVTLS